MKKLAITLVLAAVVLSVTTIRGSEVDDAINRFTQTWNRIRTYTAQLTMHQSKNNKSTDRVIECSYKSPGWFKTEVLDGDNKGAVAIYNPNDGRIRIKWGIIAIPITLSTDDRSTQGLRGEKIFEGTFGAMLNYLKRTQSSGTVTWLREEEYGGINCDVLELRHSSPSQHDGIAREIWWLSKSNGLPRRTEGYEASGVRVQWIVYRSIHINPTLASDHFEL